MNEKRVGYERIGPKQAKRFFKNNPPGNINVRMSKARIARYAAEMENGTWQVHGAGTIVIGKDGAIIDGWHRLQAIILCGLTIEFLVVYNPELTTAGGTMIDLGLPRTVAVVTGLEKDLIPPGRFITGILYHSDSEGKVSYTNSRMKTEFVPVGEIGRISSKIEPYYRALPTRKTTGFSTASVKAATIIAMAKDPSHMQEIAEQYKYLVELDQENMWPITKAFHYHVLRKMSDGGVAKRLKPMDAFLRAYWVFTTPNRESTVIRVNNPARLLQDAFDTAVDAFAV